MWVFYMALVAVTAFSPMNAASCSPGSYYEDSVLYECVSCYFGTYQDQWGSTACLPCPGNSTTLESGAESIDDCIVLCSPGSRWSDSDPRCCPVGTYLGTGTCLSCPGNSTTLEAGAESIDDCIVLCSPGSRWSASDYRCCPIGTYRVPWTCLSCPGNSTTLEAGAESIDDCIFSCSPGWYFSDGVDMCFLCPIGTYQDQWGTEACLPCPGNSTTWETGAESIDYCIFSCSPGWYFSDGVDMCFLCPIGTYQDQWFTEACLPCPGNSTTLEEGAERIDDCILECESGSVFNPEVRLCELCRIGSYRGSSDRSCLPCPPEYITESAGATSPANCSIANCTIGEFRREEDNTCQACPVGTYTEEIWRTSCDVCPPGFTTATTGSRSPADCSIPNCTFGEFKREEDNTCQACPVGTYTEEIWRTSCDVCPPGFTTATTGSRSPADCSIRVCEPGQSLHEGNNICVDCPRGSYQPESGQTECIPCPSDKPQTNFEGATDILHCRDNSTIPYFFPARVNVEVQPGQENELNRSFMKFVCNFPTSDDNDEYLYTIDWFVNDELLVSYGPSGTSDMQSLELLDSVLLENGYKLQITIKCGVSASYEPGSGRTTVIESEGFFAGITVLTPDINVSAGTGDGIVVLQPTVPLMCNGIGGLDPSCDVKIELVEGNESYDCSDTTVVVKGQLCGTKLTGFAFNEVQTCNHCWQMNISIPIRVANQEKYKSKMDFNLSFRTEHQTLAAIWSDNILPDVKVHLEDDGSWHHKDCYSVIDPHVKSSDGKNYENQREGEFILYRHKKYPLEVQEKTTPCNYDMAYCTCAVAIRAGGDIFLIDLCNDIKQVTFPSCKDDILDVRELSLVQYRVHTPIGMYIDIRLFEYHGKHVMNVHVYLSPKDLHSIEGLCGEFNGDVLDDFTLRDGTVESVYVIPSSFPESWRVPPEESLISNDNTHNPPVWPTENTLCLCAGLTAGDRKELCSVSESLICPVAKKRNGNKSAHCQIRARRPASVQYKEFNRKFETKPARRKRRRIVKRNVYNFFDAFNLCAEGLDSTQVLQFKERMIGDAFSSTLVNCANDVMPYGDTSWIAAHEEDIKTVIDNENNRDNEYAEAHPEEVLQFRQISCPDNCNNQGICRNGACACHDGFFGVTCNIDRSAQLVITDVEGGGMCDKAIGYSCHERFLIQADNLLDDFSCRIVGKRWLHNGSREEVPQHVSPGVQLDLFQGVCIPPLMMDTASTFTIELEVSISNDGVTYSEPETVYIYDSTCQSYATTATGKEFMLKTGTCFIEGDCIVFNDRHPDSDQFCFICNAEADQFGWTLSDEACWIDGECFNQGQPKNDAPCYKCSVSASQSEWTLSSDSCWIDGECYDHGEQRADATCYSCSVSDSQAQWTFSSDSCWIDGECYDQGQQRADATCYSCSVSDSQERWTLSNGHCWINGSCVADGEAKSMDPCYVCSTSEAHTDWSLQDSSCFIENTCFVEGEMSSIDTCKQCSPDDTQNDWTNVCDRSGALSPGVFVAVGLGGTVLICIVIGALCAAKSRTDAKLRRDIDSVERHRQRPRKQHRRTASDTNEYLPHQWSYLPEQRAHLYPAEQYYQSPTVDQHHTPYARSYSPELNSQPYSTDRFYRPYTPEQYSDVYDRPSRPYRV